MKQITPLGAPMHHNTRISMNFTRTKLSVIELTDSFVLVRYSIIGQELGWHEGGKSRV